MAKSAFVTFGILAILVFGLGVVSALDLQEITTYTIPQNVSQDDGSFEIVFNLENTGTNGTLNFSESEITTGIASIAFNDTFIENETTETIKATVFFNESQTGSIAGIISVKSTNISRTLNFSVPIIIPSEETIPTYNNVCEYNNRTEKGHLEITDYKIDNKDGDDDEWNYLDEIEITVDVENTDNDDIEDVEVRIIILNDTIDSEGVADITDDFDFDDDIVDSIGRLKDDEEDSVTFKIKELSSDVEKGDYYIYIMAYSDDDDFDECTSEMDNDDYFEFSVESLDYEDTVVAKGSDLPEQLDVFCGEKNIEINVPVYNLNDEDEEKVLVNLYNSELNIDEYVVINDLNDGEKEIATFFIDVPSDLAKDYYDLKVLVNFDWDDEMEEDDELAYDEQTSDESIRLNIMSCQAPSPTITAIPTSTMQVGEELTIKALITNNGQDEEEFTISLDDIEDWADLLDVDPIELTIESGKSEEVIITLLPKESGRKMFTLETTIDGKTHTQAIAVKIAEKSGFISSLGLTNSMLYLVAGIATLLVLILLAVTVKVARRTARAGL